MQGQSNSLEPDISAVLGRKTREGYLAVTACTHTIGEQSPYFSVTAELWDSEGWYRRGGPDGRMRSCGMMHEKILRAFPKLAPLVELHLANALTGEPMHVLANGWYFYSGKAHEYERSSRYHSGPTDTPHERTARTLRVDPAELPEGLGEDGFSAFVGTLRSRWAREAEMGRTLILEYRDSTTRREEDHNGTL